MFKLMIDLSKLSSGVLWNGPDVIQGSRETVEALKAKGKRVFYVTNNSSKTRREYVAKCNKLGFNATEDEIVCTAYISALYLNNIGFKGKIYVVGNPGMGEELDKFGFNHCGIGPDPVQKSTDLASFSSTELDPDVNCVLVGFDPHISYNKMVKGSSYARREGALFIATNEDSHLPLDSDVVIPGTGSIVSAVKIPARKEPIVMGKPEVNMFKALQQAFNLDPARCLMVGDRCNTDISMAHHCGIKSLLVMTGVTTDKDLEEYKTSKEEKYRTYIPTYVAPCLGELGKYL